MSQSLRSAAISARRAMKKRGHWPMRPKPVPSPIMPKYLIQCSRCAAEVVITLASDQIITSAGKGLTDPCDPQV